MDIVQKGSWKSFLKLIINSKLPWHLYVLTFVSSILVTTVLLKLPSVLEDIMTGNIFDSKIVIQYILLSILGYGLASVSSFIGVFADIKSTRGIRNTIWSKLIRVPMTFFNKQPSLQLITRVTHDPSHITNAISYVFMAINSTYLLVGSIAIMYGKNEKITLALLLTIPYIIIVSLLVGHFKQKAQFKVQQRYSGMTAFFAERLNKIKLIKSFGKEEVEIKKATEKINKQYKADVSNAAIVLYSDPLNYSLQGIIAGIVLIYGGMLVTRGELKIEALIAIYMYSNNIYNGVLKFPLLYQTIKASKGGSQEISKIFSSESEAFTREKSFDNALKKSNGNIKIENVSLKFDNNIILDNINFTIPKGKLTAIVGPSGGGKSTLLSVIERFYTPEDGKVLLGDTLAERINLDEWRKSLSYVSQFSPLLSGTIRDNITYGAKRELSEDEIRKAAEIADALDFIEKLPLKFDTEVGELASKISAGQRQRLAIARAIITNPEYLLLDEATSNVDIPSESKIWSNINEALKDKTRVVVTHNLESIKNSDQIVVVNLGKVSGIGTHDELIENNEVYRDLFNTNLRKNERLVNV